MRHSARQVFAASMAGQWERWLGDGSGDGVVAEEPAEHRAALDLLGRCGRGRWARRRGGWLLPQALVRSPLVVIGDVLPEHKRQMPLIEDEQVVEALRADGA